MNSADHARRYSEMRDGELARLVSEGRDNLTPLAREALERELQNRGLNEEALAQEYPAQHQQSRPAMAPPAPKPTGESKMKTKMAIAILIIAIIACMFPGMPLNRHQWVDLTLFSGWSTFVSLSDCPQTPPKPGETCNMKVHFAVDTPGVSLDTPAMRLKVCKKHGEVRAVIGRGRNGSVLF